MNGLMTLNDGFKRLHEIAEADRLRPNTLVMHKDVHRVFLDCYGPNAKLPVDLVAYKRHRAKAAPATVNRDLRVYRRMLRVNGFSDLVPMLKQPKKRPKVLTPEEIERLLSCVGALYPIVLFLLDTGCRRAEACSLRQENVELDNRRALIVGTKTDTDRYVPLSKRLCEVLASLPKGEWMFRWHAKDDKPWLPITFTTVLKLRFERAGLKGHGAHSLRRTFCTNAARAGIPIKTTMSITGHTQVSTLLNFYVSVSEDDKLAAIDKLTS